MAKAVEIQGLKELNAQLKSIGDELTPRALDKWLMRWGLNIAGDTQRRLSRRGKGRYTGRLGGSYTALTNRKGSTIEMQTGTNTEYAPYVEGVDPDTFKYHPPRRHFLPYKGHSEFAKWAQAIAGISEADTQSGGMMVGGEKSIRPAFVPAINENIPQMNRDVDNALNT